MENDPAMQRGDGEQSIDLDNLDEMADAAPVRKLINMVLLLAIKDQASDIHFEPFEDEFKMRYPLRRRAVRDGAAAAPPGHRHHHAASRSWPTSTSPSAACRRTAASS